MRIETIQVPIYEIGDVITITNNIFKLDRKRDIAYKAEKAMIIERNKSQCNTFSYKILCDNGKVLTLKAEELGRETYIGKADLSLLFGEGHEVKWDE